MATDFHRALHSNIRRAIVVALAATVLLVPAVASAQRNRATRVPVNARFVYQLHPAAISADARYLAYRTRDPLITGTPVERYGGVYEIFIRDLVAGTTRTLNLALTDCYTTFDERGISDDGRFLVFASTNKTLVPNDTSPVGQFAVFIYDQQSSTFERIPVPIEVPGPGYNTEPAISGDGRYVAFEASADPYSPSFRTQLFLYDRVTRQSRLISQTPGGVLSGGSRAVLNTDGRFVAFVAPDDALPGDTNGHADIYVFDRQTGGVSRIESPGPGATGTAPAHYPSINSNGRYVAFSGGGVYVRDRDVDADGLFDEPGAVRTELVSQSDAGVPATGEEVVISASGRTVAFTSKASTLLGPGGDTNDLRDRYAVDFDLDGDGLLFEPGDRRISRVSVGDDGNAGELFGEAAAGGMARDGQIIVFGSPDPSITIGDNTQYDYFLIDRVARTIRDLAQPTSPTLTPQASGDGTWVAFASPEAALLAGDTNGVTDVFVRDRRKALNAPGAIVRVSVATDGAQALGGSSDQPGISSDGRYVVFRSAATNLIGGDSNGVADIYLHDRDTDQDGIYDEPGGRSTTRVNVATGGIAPVGGASETPRISGNGRYVVYVSLASNLTPGASGFRQVYLYDRVNGITLGMSERDGVKANADAISPAVSNDGLVAFASAASNLSSIDTNGLSDIYTARAQWPYTTPRVLSLVTQTNGAAGAGASSQPALSPSGRLAFVTTAAFAIEDTNGVADVYLVSSFSPPPYTSTSTVFLLISQGDAGVGNGASTSPSLGERGGLTTVAFASAASNLVFRDLNAVGDVFRAEVIPIGGSGGEPRREQRSRQSRISLLPNGLEAGVEAGEPSVSADGTHIEYRQAFGQAGAQAGGAIVAHLEGPGKGSSNGESARITGLSPDRGPASGGTVVDLIGVGLGHPDLVPTFGAVTLQVLDRAPDFIRVVTPPAPQGAPIPRVVFPGLNGPQEIGKSVDLITFTYEATPTCVVTAGPGVISVPAAGGPFGVAVTDGTSCGWSSRATVDWLAADHAGRGSQPSVEVIAQANVDTGERRGQIIVGGSAIDVVQAGSGCNYDLSEPGASVGPSATTAGVLLRAPASCAWAVTLPVQQPQWLSVAGAASGNGSSELRFAVAENNAAGGRTGRITVGGRTFDVSQAGEAFFTLQVSHSAGGRVVSAPPGIDCGATCTAGFGQGSAVTLTAIAEPGYAFDGWNGACTGQAQCVVALTSDRTVSALFREVPLTSQTLTLSISGAGVVTSAPTGISCEPTCQATFQNGTTVTLTATAASGWRFVSWSGTGCGGVVQMTTNRVCAATFERVNTSTSSLSIEFVGSGTGRVTSAPSGIDCTTNCTSQFPADSTIVLTPTVATGSTFNGWSGDPACVSGAFKLVQATTCVARFESTQPSPTLTIAVSGSGRVKGVPTGIDCATASCAATYPSGTLVRLVAIPQPGHTLAAWGGACAGNQACTVSMSQARSVTATFQAGGGRPIQLTGLRPRSGPSGGGTKVHISGVGFQQPSGTLGRDAAVSVLIGGTPALAVDVLSDTELIAVTGTSPTPAGVVQAGLAAVVETADLTVNVGGNVGALSQGWRVIVLDGSSTTDTDGDGLPDQYQTSYSLDPLIADAGADLDGDGATNLQEYQAGTHPQGRFTRYLAEGATGVFFDTRIAFANPFTVPATALIRFQTQNAVSPSLALYVAGESRRLVFPARLPTLDRANFGTVVESDGELAVDRQMFWDRSIFGSHGGTSVAAPRTTWYLAEGSTGWKFDLFYLLQNATTTPAEVRVRFLLPSGPPLERTYTVPAQQRMNIYVDEIPELRETDVSAVIESTNGIPIIVERAMYVSNGTRPFEGGHNSAAVEEPSTHWFLAEGATGRFFNTFLLLANPNQTDAVVQVRYLRTVGDVIERTYTVPANSRRTWNIAEQDPGLRDAFMSTVVTSTNGVPVIAERSMWWPGPEAYYGSPGQYRASGTRRTTRRDRPKPAPRGPSVTGIPARPRSTRAPTC